MMATERYYNCPACQRHKRADGALFEVLLNFPKNVPNCLCGSPNELLLIPPFAFGAGGKRFKVLDAFHEKAKWKNDGTTVTFYPFLVVLENTRGRSQIVWLPYWHKDGRKLKYGERAPWTDARLFCGLFAQAHEKGYFREPLPKAF
jgi:hypothetical protein